MSLQRPRVHCCVLQVALLVVLAQAGSFVPADFLALCPFNALFTRMGTGDSIETNSSSFMLEMQVMDQGLNKD